MKVVIEYRLEDDAAGLDERLIASVFEELERVRPEWLRFDAYRETLDARCVETPVTTVVEQLGSYRP